MYARQAALLRQVPVRAHACFGRAASISPRPSHSLRSLGSSTTSSIGSTGSGGAVSSSGGGSIDDEQAAGSGERFRQHLVRLAWPQRHRIAAGGTLLAVSSGISVAAPKVIGSMMDACLLGLDGWTPEAAAGTLGVLFGVQSVAVAARGRILSVAGERVAAQLRRETFGSLVRQQCAFFDTVKQGELLSRLASDTSSLQKLVASDAVGAARGALVVGGCVVMMLSTSPALCALSCVTFPAAILFARRQGERIRARQKASQEALAGASAEAQRALGSIRTIKLFCAEAVAATRYGGLVDEARAQAEDVGYAAAVSEAGVGFALQTSMLVVLAAGGQQVIDGSLSYGELSSFLMYSLLTGFHAGSVASSYAEARRAAGASERVLALLDRDRAADRAGATLPSPTGEVELRGVSFSYPSRPHREVLDGLSLRVRAGERVALLGSSGCGKSTVAALLARLYEPTAGQVLLDGVDVADLDGNHVRRELVTVVPQEPDLLDGTLRDNIAIGMPDATDEQLRLAAAAAGCDFAAGAGWEREVGEQGLQLSGGQKQRVAIARALLRQTPILILDEPSSALDADTEKEVVGSLRAALAGRTLIVITHRPEALRLADRVVELGDGGHVLSDDGGGFDPASSRVAPA